jgi:2-methylcitrate dehydratase PrpD
LFKYHAACYLTHSPIEAVAALRQAHQLTQGDVERIILYVPQGHLKVCNIPAPTTGLEVKFSLRHTAALALAGEDTAALNTYSDAIANRPDLVALRDKVEVVTKSFPRQSPAAVDISLRHGATVSKTLDVGEPAQDLKAQWARLTHKFHSLVDPILGTDAAHACIDQCAHLEAAMDLHTLLARASR